MATTRAQQNRAVRQEALRDQLSNQGHLQHIVDILDKLRDPTEEVKDDMLARYKIVLDNKQKLLAKYIPDLKSTELTGEGGGDLSINLVNYASSNDTE